ncbi:MAG: NAD(P)/FAD-dependent oxidoreductase [Thermomicrobiales bacterium]
MNASDSNGQQSNVQEFDAIIVGAGVAGLYMLHRLRGLGLTARVIEAGDGVGGTWYWNRYPGARCDIESLDYSYSFSEELQQEWTWSERYAGQPEILRYVNHVADRFDLRRDIQFETRVTSAIFDGDTATWLVETDAGDRFAATYCIMATGCLSVPQVPQIKGRESFEGPHYYTGWWPHDGVDFTGQRVGLIGTGSSAIQSIPVVAGQADHLYVFQRTPNYSVPAHNGPPDPERVQAVKANYPEFRRRARESRSGFLTAPSPYQEISALDVSEDVRREQYEWRWSIGGFGFTGAFSDLLRNKKANETAAEFVRERIREIVDDPDTAEKLIPRDYAVGTKRLCLDTNYYETYNRDNVTLVDIRSAPIEEITSHGLRTTDAEYEFDTLVFATGFDAMTGALLRIDIRGRNGLGLREVWQDGPKTYLGISVAGFPNLFLITGPGSPSVLSNMMVSIEQHVEWTSDCIEYMEEHRIRTIEATADAQEEWVEHVNEVGDSTLYPQTNSWYMGANIPGKTRVFMPYVGGVGAYREKCDEVAAEGYAGFELESAVSADSSQAS